MRFRGRGGALEAIRGNGQHATHGQTVHGRAADAVVRHNLASLVSALLVYDVRGREWAGTCRSVSDLREVPASA